MQVFSSRVPAVEKTAPQRPANDRRLCCPNPECRRDDCLQVIEQAQLATPAVITDVGVTFPEVEADFDREEEPNAASRVLVGVRCSACGQSYIGPSPLSRLHRPT